MAEEPAVPANPCPRWRVRLAIAIAVLADGLQIVLFPLFAEGFASPLTDALDIAVAVALVALLGFHWALLPSAIVEVAPVADMFPTWTLAVAYIARGKPAG